MTPRRVLFASLIGTTIEFFDFYIYGSVAVLVFPQLFFPSADPTSAMLQSLATLALALFARPVGSAVFGHFGDRIARKATTYAAIGVLAASGAAQCCLRPKTRSACVCRCRWFAASTRGRLPV